MKTNRPTYRKFMPQQQKIEQLEKTNSRFKRVYSEYTTMSKELWDYENSEEISVTDDFLNSIKLQTDYLEEEIQHWLIDEKNME